MLMEDENDSVIDGARKRIRDMRERQLCVSRWKEELATAQFMRREILLGCEPEQKK